MDAKTFYRWRKEMGLSQEKAAVQLGYGTRMIRYWEDGSTSIPHVVGLACEALYRKLGEWS